MASFREQRKHEEKITVLTLCALLFALCSATDAQQTGKVPRVGYLIGSSLSTNSARIEAFRHGLREFGYVEGKNIVIEWRSAEEKLDRLPGLAAELVRLKVDIIITGGAPPTRAAREATATIPIVMTNVGRLNPTRRGCCVVQFNPIAVCGVVVVLDILRGEYLDTPQMSFCSI